MSYNGWLFLWYNNKIMYWTFHIIRTEPLFVLIYIISCFWKIKRNHMNMEKYGTVMYLKYHCTNARLFFTCVISVCFTMIKDWNPCNLNAIEYSNPRSSSVLRHALPQSQPIKWNMEVLLLTTPKYRWNALQLHWHDIMFLTTWWEVSQP